MATHAHSTRTPLLPLSRSAPPLLGQGLGRQSGPVTQAIRAMRAADPANQAIAAIQDGLDRHFAQAANPVLDPPQFTHGIRALSRPELEDLIGGLIDLLDAMDGDADREPNSDHEPDVDREPDEQDGCAAEWTGRGAHYFNSGRAA
ncbi:hypothetical protein [Methylobacterium sp. GC_Met_2]|uniref:hypothetical protein n=1 Tax=Methylobacterium sp. GC_Met_2 TaxID=2937376 RepID=UPI00226B7566|nr:hypothetical protein [Methylobacterium sp. GC_Met_2]